MCNRVQEAYMYMRSKQRRRDFEYEGKLDDRDRIERYNAKMRPSEIKGDDNFDPLNYERHAHNNSIFELKEGLMGAINERKANALPLAIQLFNRISAKMVTMTSLEPETDEAGVVKSINESLEKSDILLNDFSSPLMSKLSALQKYSTQKLPETIDEYRATIKNGDILQEPVDLNVMINDYRSLNNTEDQLKRVETQLNQVEQLLNSKQKKVEQMVEKKAYDAWLSQAKQQSLAAHDRYLKKMYDEYLA